jgi:hypothetical protein
MRQPGFKPAEVVPSWLTRLTGSLVGATLLMWGGANLGRERSLHEMADFRTDDQRGLQSRE